MRGGVAFCLTVLGAMSGIIRSSRPDVHLNLVLVRLTLFF